MFIKYFAIFLVIYIVVNVVFVSVDEDWKRNCVRESFFILCIWEIWLANFIGIIFLILVIIEIGLYIFFVSLLFKFLWWIYVVLHYLVFLFHMCLEITWLGLGSNELISGSGRRFEFFFWLHTFNFLISSLLRGVLVEK